MICTHVASVLHVNCTELRKRLWNQDLNSLTFPCFLLSFFLWHNSAQFLLRCEKIYCLFPAELLCMKRRFCKSTHPTKTEETIPCLFYHFIITTLRQAAFRVRRSVKTLRTESCPWCCRSLKHTAGIARSPSQNHHEALSRTLSAEDTCKTAESLNNHVYPAGNHWDPVCDLRTWPYHAYVSSNPALKKNK